MSQPLDFETFGGELLARLRVVPTSEVRRSSTLFDDMSFDSLLAFQLVVVVEEMADLIAPMDELPPLWTMGDAYDYYVQACAEADAPWP